MIAFLKQPLSLCLVGSGEYTTEAGMHCADSLIQHCKTDLENLNRPDNIHILDDLPKGHLAKSAFEAP